MATIGEGDKKNLAEDAYWKKLRAQQKSKPAAGSLGQKSKPAAGSLGQKSKPAAVIPPWVKPVAGAGQAYRDLASSQQRNQYGNLFAGYQNRLGGMQPATYPNAGWQTGNYTGQSGTLSQPYTYGQVMGTNDYNDALYYRVRDYIVDNQSYAPRNMTQTSADKAAIAEMLDILREQRRGFQIGGPGIDEYSQQTLPKNNGRGDYSYSDGGGYGGGYGDYRYPSYASGNDNDINRWYANMVQWNINRPKSG